MLCAVSRFEIDRKSPESSDPSFYFMASHTTGRSPPLDGSGRSRVSEIDLESSTRDFSGSMDNSSSGGSEMKADDARVSGSTEASAIDRSEIARHASSSSSGDAATHGFQLGDMVWGKVKSHPWWPGHIFNKAFASAPVRRMKREEGHVLVAFFGDSSYGWFDPAELIPFAPHYSEKSRQTNSRVFLKAIEEAIDELKRRAALPFACCCRHPLNFHQTGVPGYFSVDVVGYEPGGIYSSHQIKKARDEFLPVETLSFVNRLAVMPRSEQKKNIDWIRSMAALLAFRRAAFEEFDETYAQAFGVEPVRPPQKKAGVPDQVDNFAPRAAPLSGALVIAEALGGNRTSKAPNAQSSYSKKNKYELKRRDEIPTVSHQPLPDSAIPTQEPAAKSEDNASFDLAPGQQPQASSVISSLPNLREAAAGNSSLVKSEEKRATEDSGGPDAVWEDFDDRILRSRLASKDSELTNSRPDEKPSVDSKYTEGTQNKLDDGIVGALDLELKPVKSEAATTKKKKSLKRAVGEAGEVKKKKKKDVQSVPDPTEKEPHRKAAAVEPASDNVGIGSVSPAKLDLESLELDLPQLVTDLSALALDPYHGIERDAPDIVRHVILRFRSLVYQKSLPVHPSLGSEITDARSTSPPVAHLVPETGTRDKPEVSSKPISRPDDPTKAGRKRAPSDRQEDKSAKRLKKLSQVKALPGEKKSEMSQKAALETRRDSTSSAPAKKPDPPPPAPPRVPHPTFLVMKFPQDSTLPSIASLKAKFGRFGALDLDATRVFWKSYTCKVLFKYKSDAQNAHNHAKNNDLFGQLKVFYHLREADAESDQIHGNQPRHGNQNRSYNRHSSAPLKSILKKQSDDLGSNGSKEAARVKFMLGADDGGIRPRISSPPIVKNSKVANFLPPPPPSNSRIPPNPSMLPPPPHPRNVLESSRSRAPEPLRRGKRDVSQQMMTLLLRCSDIVARVESSLGYVPYHAL